MIKSCTALLYFVPDTNSDIRKRELDNAGKGKGKRLGFWAMDAEKNFTSSLDRADNKPFSLGRLETHKITWSDNPPIKVTLFWSRHESKKVTGTGHYAWTSWRTQEKVTGTGHHAWTSWRTQEKVTGTGHHAWTCWRTQETGKTTDAMAWQHQGSNRPAIGRPKRSSTR